MEIKQIDAILFRILYLLVAGIAVSEVLSFSDLTSALFILTFPLTVALWARSVRKTLTGLDFLVIVTAALAVVNVLINASLTDTPLTFDYIKKLIMFIMSLLFLQTSYRMKAGQDLVRFVNNLVDFLTLFFIVMFFVDNTEMHMIGEYVSSYLTFRFSNPNLTGLFLVSMYMLELYRLFSPEKRSRKLVHIIMAGFLAYFTLLSQSRNSILALVIFTVICAWLMFKSRRSVLRINKFWATVISLSPALFAVGYMILIEIPWIQNILSFLTGEGKNLSSRVAVWRPALENLLKSPLFGAYSQVSDGTGMSQLHNTHIDIAGSYGIIVLILVCILLYKYFYQNGRYYSNKSSYIYILAFACAIFLGIGEAALFSGSLGLYAFIGTLLMFSDVETKKA
ncbi:MAG: O-antigen ligase family protein [Oscillospiraceae bacterium]|nr:O-antigen ligase family protein [Oscillospiraceae bacterium]